MLRLVTLLCLSTAAFGTPFQAIPRLDGRIVGGTDAEDITQHPYQLSLQIAGTHECGAVIINDQWALTAAQCVGGSILGMNLRAGTINRDAADETDGTSHSVTQKLVHPEYNPATSDSDLALLQVYPFFEFGDSGSWIIAPVILPGKDDSVPSSALTVTGWGNTNFGGIPAKILQLAKVTAVDATICKTDYEEVGSVVTDNMVCAGGEGKDACQGDSGGPLVREHLVDPKKDVLVGIVSWGRSCAQAKYPRVYTKVSAFADWIVSRAKLQ